MDQPKESTAGVAPASFEQARAMAQEAVEKAFRVPAECLVEPGDVMSHKKFEQMLAEQQK